MITAPSISVLSTSIIVILLEFVNNLQQILPILVLNHRLSQFTHLLDGNPSLAQGDAFQAKATYQSIVDGYTDKTDGVVDEALKKIESLK